MISRRALLRNAAIAAAMAPLAKLLPEAAIAAHARDAADVIRGQLPEPVPFDYDYLLVFEDERGVLHRIPFKRGESEHKRSGQVSVWSPGDGSFFIGGARIQTINMKLR